MKVDLLALVLTLYLAAAPRSSSFVEGQVQVCPRKEHLVGTRVCKKECKTDLDCRGRKKKCVCDDVCGLTCLNPRGKCSDPEIANGIARISGRNQLGAVARYTCDKGYELQGIQTRICNGDREWSGIAPICMPVGKDSRDPLKDVPQNIDPSSAWCSEPPSVAYADHNGAKQTYFMPGSEVFYSCRAGYVGDGITMAKCTTQGKWAGPLMMCREEVCTSLGDLTNGNVYGSEPYNVGSTLNYECNKGYRLIGKPTLTCRRGGLWDSMKPLCEPAATDSCERPDGPRYGAKILRSTKVDSVMTIICDVGYRLKGPSKRICRKDGTWSGEEPECLPVDCGYPGDLYNGYIEGKRYTYGSAIKYRCLDGAKFDGLAVAATCLETGNWSFPLPKCHRSCSRPEISNAQVFEGNKEAPLILEHQTRISIVCQTGLTPNLQDNPVCNNGTWSHLPSCVQGGCDNRPKEIANGMALYRSSKYGDRVRYTCNAGYQLVGDKYLICEGGEWKGNLPQCKPVYCPHPGELENGKILLVGDIGKFEYRPYVRHAGQGEKIEYYCSSNFRLEGPSAATCIDGVWSPERRPRCIDNQHPMLPGSQELFMT